MTYLKTIMAVLAVIVFTAAMVVLPFVLLHWGMGVGIVCSIIGSWAWTALVLCILLLTDLTDGPDEDEEGDQ
jgi:hypothetical protein